MDHLYQDNQLSIYYSKMFLDYIYNSNPQIRSLIIKYLNPPFI